MAAAAITLVVFGLSLGCLIALALLIFSIEESGQNLSQSAVPLTQAVMMLAEGVGYRTDSLIVTIMPLLLTGLMIVLIRAFVLRFKLRSVASWASGVFAWVVLQLIFTHSISYMFIDATFLIIVKLALMYSIGYVWAALPGSKLLERAKTYITSHISEQIRRVCRIAFRCSGIMLGIYAAAGIITAIVWICMDFDNMVRLFTVLNMQTGSRICMSIMALAWLPNLCIWAIAWLFGAEFNIGTLATYSMWQASSKDLPGLPIFGLFPQPVGQDAVRTLFILIPLVTSLVTGLVLFMLRKCFPILRNIHLTSASAPKAPRTASSNAGVDAKPAEAVKEETEKSEDQQSSDQAIAQIKSSGLQQLFNFAYAAGAFCIIAVVVCLVANIVFTLSNGALGEHELAHVGVPVANATNAVAKPTAYGLILAWLIAAVVAAAVFGVRLLLARRATAQTTTEDGKKPSPETHDEKRKSHTPRVVNSNPTMKEHNGDDEPTITTSPRIGLS
ncbi:DUF6350 family protein [Bifidobacterium dolichotidis]|nr:DUF6350 family protein [Bifidobacterium dolichotidis]